MTKNHHSIFARRRRMAAATMLVAAGAVAVGAVSATAPANATAGGKFAAVAYSPETGSFGYWTNAPTFQGANVGALNQCTQNGGNHCLLAAWAQNGCVALAVDALDNGHWHGANGPTFVSAETAALQQNQGGVPRIKTATC
jgi:hypothetical protein